jgi:hypothetical protein
VVISWAFYEPAAGQKSHARMRHGIGPRDEVEIDLARHVGPPMIGGMGPQHQTKENVGENDTNSDRANRAAIPALRGGRGLPWGQGKLQCVFSGAGGDADHAGAALGGTDLDKLVDGEAGRAHSRALGAIDAGLCVTPNPERAE